MKRILLIALITTLSQAQTDGSLDPSFGTAGKVITNLSSSSTDFAYDGIQLADNSILVGGYTTLNGLDNLLIKYLPNGQLDTTFGVDGISIIELSTLLSQARKIGLQSDGKIILAGRAGASIAYSTVVRANPNGTIDPTFGTDGYTRWVSGSESDIQALMILPNDKIIVVGYVLNDSSDIQAIKLNADGSYDTTFGTNGVAVINFESLPQRAFSAVMNGDKVLIGGVVNNPNESSVLVQLNADGSLDTAFGTNGYSVAQFGPNPQNRYDRFSSIKIFQNKIYGVGFRALNAFNYNINLAKFTIDGVLDTTFSDDGKLLIDTPSDSDFINDLNILQDGSILAAGVTTYPGSGSSFLMVKLNPDGTYNSDFGNNGIIAINVGSSSSSIQKLIINDTNLIAVGNTNTSVSSNVVVAKFFNSNPLTRSGNELKTAGFGVYPNPAGNELYISGDGLTDISTIEVLDLAGKVLIKQENTTIPVNVNNLSKGIYLVRVYSGKSLWHSKFIKG